MSIEENIKTAEEHLEAEANRELDRLLGTLVDDSVYEESLLEKPVQGMVYNPFILYDGGPRRQVKSRF